MKEILKSVLPVVVFLLGVAALSRTPDIAHAQVSNCTPSATQTCYIAMTTAGLQLVTAPATPPFPSVPCTPPASGSYTAYAVVSGTVTAPTGCLPVTFLNSTGVGMQAYFQLNPGSIQGGVLAAAVSVLPPATGWLVAQPKYTGSNGQLCEETFMGVSEESHTSCLWNQRPNCSLFDAAGNPGGNPLMPITPESRVIESAECAAP